MARNKVLIYTDKCKLCGKTEEYASVAIKLSDLADIEVRQTTLWGGWAQEAMEIGLELPFLYCVETHKSITVKEAEELDLEEWLRDESE